MDYRTQADGLNNIAIGVVYYAYRGILSARMEPICDECGGWCMTQCYHHLNSEWIW